jgi:hypothetical protein
MQITRNVLTVNDLNNWYEEKTLVINKDYQREGGIWVPNARTYFIDTILNEYPFPKITIRQIINPTTRKTLREIIDGQQRMMAINAFIKGELTLSSVSERFAGQKYTDFTPEAQEAFLRYEVSIDNVISATDEEVLDIFRRMNSYTIPLNPSEHRHATYQGLFKWFIRDLIKKYSPMFLTFRILSKRALSRMMDADLMTELNQILVTGVTGRKIKALEDLYKNNDKVFPNKDELAEKTEAILNYVKDNLTDIGNSGYLTGYMLYSLFGAMAINRYGNITTENNYFDDLPAIGRFTPDGVLASQKILEMFSAVDRKDFTGEFGEFAYACSRNTDSLKQRQIRVKWLAKALRNEL